MKQRNGVNPATIFFDQCDIFKEAKATFFRELVMQLRENAKKAGIPFHVYVRNVTKKMKEIMEGGHDEAA